MTPIVILNPLYFIAFCLYQYLVVRFAKTHWLCIGLPAPVLAKITEGRLNGFFKDVVLLEQPSVQESKKNVKAVLDEAGVSVKRFARFEIGQ